MRDMTGASMLTPLERLHLRDSLQDGWREVVTQITELSVALHTTLEDRDEAEPRIDIAAIASRLSEARLHLVEIEQAMHRLDDRTYGRCSACLMPIALPTLVRRPESTCCQQCRTSSTASPTATSAATGS